MQLDSFNRLPLDQKTNYMWDHGVCLAQRVIENRYILCIFEVNGFFVEAIYSRRNNRVFVGSDLLATQTTGRWLGLCHTCHVVFHCRSA